MNSQLSESAALDDPPAENHPARPDPAHNGPLNEPLARLALAPALLTAPLRREIARVLPARPFRLRFWDGTGLSANADDAPEFYVRRPAAIAHFLRAPNELGLGRAYVAGDLVVDDLEAAFLVVDHWEPPPIALVDRARLSAAALVACGWSGPPRRPKIELNLRGRRHTLRRDDDAIRYHYDVGNEFFELFLDSSMTYSCGIFSRGAQTLEQAQEAKLELVATKLGLRPGQRVLDVGCGWGSFAIHAAKNHGVEVIGITLSQRQAELARKRVFDAGLADRVEIRIADYRRLGGSTYDAISSIGMVEHVGASQIDRYARTLQSLLKPGAALLNHGIALLRPDDDPTEDLFSNRYVFPDGEPLPLSRVQLALERAGLHTEHIEGFQGDYATTLQHWIDRLDEHLPEATALAGEQRTRVWRLYLRAARHGFDVGFTSVYQVLARQP